MGSAAASRNPRVALAAKLDLIKFATTGEGIMAVKKGRGLYLGTKKDNLVIAKTKTIVSVKTLYLSININTNIIITKIIVITKH